MSRPTERELTTEVCRGDRDGFASQLRKAHRFRTACRELVDELDDIAAAVRQMPDDTVEQRKTKLHKAQQFAALNDWYKPERWVSTMQRRPMYVVGDVVFLNGSLIGVVGSNQCAKTTSFATGLALWLRDKAPKGCKGWCVAPSQEKSVDKQQKTIWDMMPRKMFPRGVQWTPRHGFGGIRPSIVLDPDDRNITMRFKSTAQFDSDPRAFESDDLHFIWIDESVEERHYQALLPRLVSNGVLMGITTVPDVAWMHDAIAEAPPDADVRYHKMTIWANRRNLGAGAIEKMKARMTPEEVEMRIYGNFRYLEGIVYNEFIRRPYPEGNVVSPSEVPSDVKWFGTMDVGMDHPTVFLLCAIDRENRFYVVDEYVSRNTPIDVDSQRILSLIGNRQLAQPVVIDPSAFRYTKASRMSVAEQYQMYGIPMRPGIPTVKYGEWNAVHEIKMRLRDMNILVCEGCDHLMREFRTWSYKRDQAGKPLGREAFEDKNNDALDALRYLMTLRPVYLQERTKVLVKEW